MPVGYFFGSWTPYPEWWRDRPFEATATGSDIRIAGANSGPFRGKDKVRFFIKPLLILCKKRFFCVGYEPEIDNGRD
jgi:hypothetical protein